MCRLAVSQEYVRFVWKERCGTTQQVIAASPAGGSGVRSDRFGANHGDRDLSVSTRMESVETPAERFRGRLCTY